MNIDDYLQLDRSALDKLPIRDQFTILGQLAVDASAWISDQRGLLVDRLREQGYSDPELAELLQVSRQRIADLGEGPRTPEGIKPRLLRRGAEILLEHALVDGQPKALEYVTTALNLLAAAGRPNRDTLWSAAQRIKMAGKAVRDTSGLPEAERLVLSRALGHASWVAGRGWLSGNGDQPDEEG